MPRTKKEPAIRLTRIARKLTIARIASGLTQEQLAMKLNVSIETVHSWETGRRVTTAPRLELWAGAVGCELTISPSEEASKAALNQLVLRNGSVPSA